MSLQALPDDLKATLFGWLTPNPRDCGTLLLTCKVLRNVAYNLEKGVFKAMYLQTGGDPSSLPNTVEDYQAHLKQFYRWHALLEGTAGRFAPLGHPRQGDPASKGLWPLGPHHLAESLGSTTIHIWNTTSNRCIRTLLLDPSNTAITSVALHGHALFSLTRTGVGARLHRWTDFRQPSAGHRTLDIAENPACLLPWGDSLLVGTPLAQAGSRIREIDPATMVTHRTADLPPRGLREILTYDDPIHGPQLQILCGTNVYTLDPDTLQLNSPDPSLDYTVQPAQGAGKAYWIRHAAGEEIIDASTGQPVASILAHALPVLNRGSHLQHEGKEYITLHNHWGALWIWNLTDETRLRIVEQRRGPGNALRVHTEAALLTPHGLYLARPEDPSLMRLTPVSEGEVRVPQPLAEAHPPPPAGNEEHAQLLLLFGALALLVVVRKRLWRQPARPLETLS